MRTGGHVWRQNEVWYSSLLPGSEQNGRNLRLVHHITSYGNLLEPRQPWHQQNSFDVRRGPENKFEMGETQYTEEWYEINQIHGIYIQAIWHMLGTCEGASASIWGCSWRSTRSPAGQTNRSPGVASNKRGATTWDDPVMATLKVECFNLDRKLWWKGQSHQSHDVKSNALDVLFRGGKQRVRINLL